MSKVACSVIGVFAQCVYLNVEFTAAKTVATKARFQYNAGLADLAGAVY